MISSFVFRFQAITAEKLPQASLGTPTVQRVLGFVFALAGALALLVITIAAFRYSLSRGDANAIKTSKETIIYAAIGLLIAMMGYGIVTSVFKAVK